MRHRVLLGGLLFFSDMLGGSLAHAEDQSPIASKVAEERFNTHVVSLVRQYCSGCHGSSHAEADLNLESFVETSLVADAYPTWRRALSRLEEREMPPANAGQPTEAERKQAIQALKDTFAHLAEVRAGDPGPVLLRRLTNAEYDNTIHDLTGVDLRLASEFPGDGAAGEGFTNTGQSLTLSAELLDKYVDATQRIASHALFLTDGTITFFDEPANDRPGKAIALLSERINARYEHLHPNPADYYAAAWEFEHREALGSSLNSLEEAARHWKLSANYLNSIWMLLKTEHPTLILQTLQDAWRGVPIESARNASVDGGVGAVRQHVRAVFQAILIDGRDGVPGLVTGWQDLLCDNLGGPQDLDATDKRTVSLTLPESLDEERKKPVRIHFLTRHVGDAEGKIFFRHLRFVPPEPEKEPDGSPDPEKKPRGPIRLYDWLARHAPKQLEGLPWGEHPPDQELKNVPLVLIASTVHSIELPLTAARALAGWTLQADVELVSEKRLGEGYARAMAFCQASLYDGDLPAALPALWPGEPILSTERDQQIRVLASYGEFQKWYRSRFAWRPNVAVGSEGDARGPQTPSFVREYRHRFDPDNLLSRIKPEYHTNTDGFGNLRFLTAHRYDAPLRQLVLDPEQRREWNQLYRDLWVVGRVPRRSLDNFKHENRTNLIEGLGATNPNDAITLADDRIEETIRRGFFVDFFGKSWQATSVDHALAIYHWIRRDLRQWEEDYRKIETVQVQGLVNFAERAWRRPLQPSEAAQLRAFYSKTAGEPEMDRDEALRTVMVRILTSPDFLFRVEREAASNKASPVTDHELAVRLSYFLWASPPDAGLRRAADAGRLRDPKELRSQTSRMLRDTRARRFVEEFFGQMYQFANFESYQGPDPQRFPEFTDDLRSAMHEEPVRLLEKIVRDDRSVDEILFADYAWVNRLLARHYGLEVPHSVQDDQTWWQVDKVASVDRGGLLGMAAMLTRFSDSLRTSPVRRGDWLNRSVLGVKLPLPPMSVPELPAEEDAGDGLTLRERLSRHREDSGCAKCHAKFDGYGFALEGFDPIGRRRTTDGGGRPLDLRGSVEGSRTFEGFAGLRDFLRLRRDRFRRNLCEKLVGYALGRTILLSDEQLVDRMTTELEQNDGRFSVLVTTLVNSQQFRYRRGAEGPEKEEQQ